MSGSTTSTITIADILKIPFDPVMQFWFIYALFSFFIFHPATSSYQLTLAVPLRCRCTLYHDTNGIRSRLLAVYLLGEQLFLFCGRNFFRQLSADIYHEI